MPVQLNNNRGIIILNSNCRIYFYKNGKNKLYADNHLYLSCSQIVKIQHSFDLTSFYIVSIMDDQVSKKEKIITDNNIDQNIESFNGPEKLTLTQDAYYMNQIPIGDPIRSKRVKRSNVVTI